MATREERATRLVLDATSELRCAGHQPAGVNEYSSCISPGYKVESSNGVDTVRVEHKLPEFDLSDPDRMSIDERHLARLAARDAYAGTLRAAGWTVTERTVLGNRPVLFAAAPSVLPVAAPDGVAVADPVPVLAPLDLEIIRFMAEGLFNYQVALKLGVKPEALASRIGVIYRRTGTGTPAQLVATALRQKWID